MQKQQELLLHWLITPDLIKVFFNTRSYPSNFHLPPTNLRFPAQYNVVMLSKQASNLSIKQNHPFNHLKFR